MQKSPKLDSVPPYESWPRTSASWPQVGNLFRKTILAVGSFACKNKTMVSTGK